MTTAAATTKFSTISTKFQVGVAALAVASAATLTPVVAHAAPSLVSFAEGIGNSAELIIDPVIATPGSAIAPKADAIATPGSNKAPKADQIESNIGYLLEGLTRGTVIIGGTLVYVTLNTTGQLITLTGEILGPLGGFLVDFGQQVVAFSNVVADATKTGPYLGT